VAPITQYFSLHTHRGSLAIEHPLGQHYSLSGFRHSMLSRGLQFQTVPVANRPVRSDVRPGQFQDSGSELPGSWNRGPADRKRAGSACHPGMLPPGGSIGPASCAHCACFWHLNGAMRMQRNRCVALNYLLARFPALRISADLCKYFLEPLGLKRVVKHLPCLACFWRGSDLAGRHCCGLQRVSVHDLPYFVFLTRLWAFCHVESTPLAVSTWFPCALGVAWLVSGAP
jgi:hypothetical protein